MIINFYFACTLAITLMLIVPTILIFALKNKPRILKPIIVTLFVIYLVLLFVGTAGKISLKSDVLKISFDFSHEWFSAYFSWFELSAGNILINLLLLFPIGFVVYTFSQQHPFVKTILIALGISAIIELYQWMLPVFRNSEVSDIIFNTISGVISACYCELLKKLGAFPKQGLLK